MSYNKTIWSAGDTITAEKLNNIEEGIAAADKPVYEPETVTGEGDVSITYDGNQIGVLNDSGTLTLDTEGKIAEHSIGIEYTKTSGVTLSPVTVSVTGDIGDSSIYFYNDSAGFVIIPPDNDNLIYVGNLIAQFAPQFTIYFIPGILEDNYHYSLMIESQDDVLNVTVNNVKIVHNLDYSAYICEYTSTTFPESLNITISPKN